jgi:hypothetical protein
VGGLALEHECQLVHGLRAHPERLEHPGQVHPRVVKGRVELERPRERGHRVVPVPLPHLDAPQARVQVGERGVLGDRLVQLVHRAWDIVLAHQRLEALEAVPQRVRAGFEGAAEVRLRLLPLPRSRVRPCRKSSIASGSSCDMRRVPSARLNPCGRRAGALDPRGHVARLI